MEHQKPDATPEKSKDELQRLLKEALRKKRPRWYRNVLFTTFLVLGLLALLVWLLFPKGEPPNITVVAFDDVGVRDTAVTLSGRLVVDSKTSLQGKDVVFIDDQGLLVPGRQPRDVLAKTGPQGEVSCSWTFPLETPQGDFILRLIGDKFRPGMEDRGSIFLFPKATPLCLVQIDGTLTSTKDQDWNHEKIQDIILVAGAAEALQEIHNKGYEIVYLALAAEEPALYQKMRGWVRHQTVTSVPPFPPGAVMSRFSLPSRDSIKPWQKTGERLNRLFVLPQDGGAVTKHLAIAGTIAVAQQFTAAGLRTLYLGAGEDISPKVQRVTSWEEVRRILEK